MYLEFLATAMNGSVPDGAHPGFVDLIKQLTAAETPSLQSFVCAGHQQPIVELRASLESQTNSFTTPARELVDARDEAGDPVYDPNLQLAVNNWQRLGLVQIVYGAFLTEASAYAWVETRPEYLDSVDWAAQRGQIITVERGVMTFTAFGLAFAHAVGMLLPRHHKAPRARSKALQGPRLEGLVAAVSGRERDSRNWRPRDRIVHGSS